MFKRKIAPVLLVGLLITTQAKTAAPTPTALTYTPTPAQTGLRLQLAAGHKTFWNKNKKDKAKKLVISHPDQLLQKNEEINEDLEDDLSIVTPAWFEEESRNNPLCLLSECTEGCNLVRFHTTARNDFENKIIQTIKNDSNIKKNTVFLNYTSFACGALLPDLIIVTRLIDQGFKKININLIDTYFYEYIKALKERGSSIPLDVVDTPEDKGLWLRHNTYRLVQFLDWFSNDSGTEISVTIYDSAESYVRECINNSAMKSDIIVGIDFERSWTAEKDFKLLVIATLKKNRYAFGLDASLMHNGSSAMMYKKSVNLSDEVINSILNSHAAKTQQAVETQHKKLNKLYKSSGTITALWGRLKIAQIFGIQWMRVFWYKFASAVRI